MSELFKMLRCLVLFRFSSVGLTIAFVNLAAIAQNLPSALPTGGAVVAGSASIAQSNSAMQVNQSSRRAIINWSSYNVGKNASVTYNQPDAQSSTLNRVTGSGASLIDGAVQANGQVVIVNPNGVAFGKGAEVNAAAIVASTLDTNDKDFMEGKSRFSGESQASVVNHGKLKTNELNGYIAMLGQEVRNQGVILAQASQGNAVALAAGQSVTLNFQNNQLMSVKVDAASYRALIENKRLVEAPGGIIIIAAGSAANLMGSVVQNKGRISTASMVRNGGSIEIVAGVVSNKGSINASSLAANGNGGVINVQAQRVELANKSDIKADAAQSGNGGSITIHSTESTQIAGQLSAKGGVVSGDGGSIQTTSQGSVQIDAADLIALSDEQMHMTYKARMPDGSIIQGRTDPQGLTTRLTSPHAGIVKVLLGDDDWAMHIDSDEPIGN